MLKIGITGGIGSGKTTVCKIFETLDIQVYYADDRAKWLMANNAVLVTKIKDLLGAGAYHANGTLNRAFVAEKIFNDDQLRLGLNALVHPAVQHDGREWFKKQANAPYALYEAALLYESGGYKGFDKIIVVTAPEDVRINRVVKRDNSDPDAVAARIRSQLPESEKVARADYIINNDGTQSLLKQVLELHHTLLQESTKDETNED